ncbi:MAG: hypothetical protein AAF126_06850 [Chloroflexota bacterium]
MRLAKRHITMQALVKGSAIGSVWGLVGGTLLALVAGVALMDHWDILLVMSAYVVGLPLLIMSGVVLGIRHFAQREKYAQMLSYVGKKQKREA